MTGTDCIYIVREGGRYSVEDNKLVINPVTASDAGSYKCLAENAVGISNPSPAIRVNVMGPPVFTMTPPALVR